VGFVVDKVALGQLFFPEYLGFRLSISFHRCSITRKNKKTQITFITGLHNKPQSYGVSRPYHLLRGPSQKKKKPDITFRFID
jgi:hypothetical protein